MEAPVPEFVRSLFMTSTMGFTDRWGEFVVINLYLVFTVLSKQQSKQQELRYVVCYHLLQASTAHANVC